MMKFHNNKKGQNFVRILFCSLHESQFLRSQNMFQIFLRELLFQTTTRRSSPPVARNWPSSETHKLVMGPLWAWIFPTERTWRMSQTLRAPEPPPTRIVCPSKAKQLSSSPKSKEEEKSSDNFYEMICQMQCARRVTMVKNHTKKSHV